MNISKATLILGIEDIFSESLESLKKKYRILIKKYHPDSLEGDIEKSKEVLDAYNLLKDELPKLLSYKESNINKQVITIGLSFDNLLRLYSGDTIKMYDLELNKSNIYTYNTIILLDFTVTYDNKSETFTDTSVLQINREYNIWGNVYVNNVSEDKHIRINVCDKYFEYDMKSQSIKIPFKFSDTKLNVILDKKVKE